MAWRRLVRSTKEYLERVRDPYPPVQQTLFTFGTPADLTRWSVFSDAEFGGSTTAALRPSPDFPGTAEFAGECAGADPDAATPVLRRGGFCGASATPAPDGTGSADLSAYDTLLLRVRSDGRPYVASLRTENWLVGGASHDVWQAFLFAPPGGWHIARIPFARFLLTHRGRLVEARHEMNAARVVSLGVSLTAGTGGAGTRAPGGPFCLGLDWVRVESMERGAGGKAGEGGKGERGGDDGVG